MTTRNPLVRPCRERITRTDFFLLAFNQDTLGIGRGKQRPVDLECGHKALTSNQRIAECLRCTEMLRRSIETGEEDYDAFRNGNGRDRMIWRDDPCRQFNEPTDMEGNFINDRDN